MPISDLSAATYVRGEGFGARYVSILPTIPLDRTLAAEERPNKLWGEAKSSKY